METGSLNDIKISLDLSISEIYELVLLIHECKENAWELAILESAKTKLWGALKNYFHPQD